MNNLNKELQLIEVKKSNIEKTSRELGGFFKYPTSKLSEKEKLLIKHYSKQTANTF